MNLVFPHHYVPRTGRTLKIILLKVLICGDLASTSGLTLPITFSETHHLLYLFLIAYQKFYIKFYINGNQFRCWS